MRHADPHVRFVDLSSGSEHDAGGESGGPRRDIDDAVLAVRERSGGRNRLAAERPFLCSITDWLSDGPVRRVPLADVVYEDRWGQTYRDLQ